jgi:uncharacterized damage-inducible protein DinB
MLDDAYHGPAWHGPALRQTLAGCTYEEAQRRLAPGRNTIHELVMHAAYSKHLVRVRLTSERQRFPRPLARPWWPRVVSADRNGWEADLHLLDTTHVSLAEAVAGSRPSQLARKRPGKRWTIGEELMGMVLHDIYHAGQIALIRKVVSA